MLKLTDVVLDCPDPLKLARFYADLSGSHVASDSDDDWARVPCGSFNLAFQKAPDHQRPRWPDPEKPQQVHIDLEVDDFDAEGRRAVKLGATLQKNQVGESGYGFMVYIDPAGHPFCLCRSRPVE
ncbi:MAG: VOC family protein [Stackebrandtia sp.]